MSGILEVYLWLVIGKIIRNNSGNCHIVGIDQITMSPIELLKCCYQFGFLISLAQQLYSEHFPTHALWSPDNLNRLWNNGLTVIRKRVWWCRRDITAQEWKVNNGKIEVIPTRRTLCQCEEIWCCSESDVVWRVSRLPPWQSSSILELNDSAILNLHFTPILPIKFRLNLTYCLGGDVIWRISRWRPSWTLEQKNFSNSEFPYHPNASHHV